MVNAEDVSPYRIAFRISQILYIYILKKKNPKIDFFLKEKGNIHDPVFCFDEFGFER